MCKFVDIFITKTGHFGLLYLTNFRPCLIAKSWIASPLQARNDTFPFLANVLKKGTPLSKKKYPLGYSSKKEEVGLSCSLACNGISRFVFETSFLQTKALKPHAT